MENSQLAPLPTITVSDVTAQDMTITPSKYFTYERDGLVPICGDDINLGRLLRDYGIDGEDDKFLTKKLLQHILTRRRIKAELRKPSYCLNDHEVDAYTDKIHPQSEGSSSEVYLKIFALLVLVKRSDEISNFINEKFCDHILPIEVKQRKVYFQSRPDTSVPYFENWDDVDIENFEMNQWKVNTPYFSSTKEEFLTEVRLPKRARRPWRKTPSDGNRPDMETRDNSGAYAKVTRIDIHPTAHSFKELLAGINLGRIGFALKTLYSMDENTEKAFRNELNMLKRFSGLTHPNLVTALSAINHKDEWSFIFPNASCALDQYMETSTPLKERGGAYWISSQITGLMGALETIHNPKHLHLGAETKRYGRHGDIKCDNILCFKGSGTENQNVLVISDFGLSAFNTDKSRSNIPNRQVPPVPGYRPPECDIDGGTISRAFDIWTIGCLFLELITWWLGGYGYFKEFETQRTTPFINGARNNIFFTFRSGKQEGTYVIIVKPEVEKWILKLHGHQNCSPFLHDVLNIIEQDMLVVLSKTRERLPSDRLLAKFKKISEDCKEEENYIKKSPWTHEEIESARERQKKSSVAVEVVPSQIAQALMQDLKKPLPKHYGETKKSLQAEDYNALD
ncbi:hypothetical protein HG530_008425 [Fusarium avenaceum]|nr:hypothetical protein HG530_008425 [Fusarium avenaceum]